ncbi:MAG: PaaI family thioesterase [Myxococcaceae bacterium]
MTARPSPYPSLTDFSAEAFNRFGATTLPGYTGIEIVSAEPRKVVARMAVRPEILSPNGYLHGATPVILADTLCGYGCIMNLPEGSAGFTTVELKANLISTARSGFIRGEATPVHCGRTTQVWDAVVTDERDGKLLATFRCTQLVLRK